MDGIETAEPQESLQKLLCKGESELQSGVKSAEDLEPGHLGPVLTDFLCDLGTVLHLSEPRFLIYKTGKK